MSKKAIASCPNPAAFSKWWRNRANRNAEDLADAGRALRASNYTVTEQQVNSRFKVVSGNPKPGEVLAKLQDCGIPCYDMNLGEFKLGWSPKEFDKLRAEQVKSAQVVNPGAPEY